jgi:hypothetical protein
MDFSTLPSKNEWATVPKGQACDASRLGSNAKTGYIKDHLPS